MIQLRIKVDYYNKSHVNKFKRNPDFKLFNALAGNIVDISVNEFNTYFIFTEQHDSDGFRKYSELKERFKTRVGLLEHLDFSKQTIHAKTPYKSLPKDIRERVGVSVSLCLANKIYDLTEADWEGIPETNKNKTLDFNICTDGHKYIYVESKGSAVKDNSRKSSSISKHKSSIESKKASSKSTTSNVFFGVITAIDNQSNQYTQSWLLDPNAPVIQMESDKYKLLSRLYFYKRCFIPIVGVRSAIIIALSNRINIINKFGNYKSLTRMPLYNGDGSIIDININSYTTKSHLAHRKALGNIYPIGDNKILFVGFTYDIFSLITSQDFEEIVKYKSKEQVVRDVLICRLGLKEIEEFKEYNYNFDIYKQKGKRYIEFELSGDFNFTKSGKVYSIINIEQLNIS